MLSAEEKSRYARHFVLPDFGIAGQEKLKASRVLCVGAGGLGSPALLYLAAAGVGRIGIIDPDRVEASNLQRQIIHPTSCIGQWKVDSAAAAIRAVNPHVVVDVYPQRLTKDNALAIIEKYDLVVDGCDNFATRYLTSDVCTWLKKPNVYASIQHFEGQLSVFAPHLGGPCYRCMVPTPPAPGTVANCADAGVLGVLPGILGSLQATEAVKLLVGIGRPMVGRLLHVNTLTMAFREFQLQADPECAVCGKVPSITQPMDYDEFCGVHCSTPLSQPPPLPVVPQISAADFLALMKTATLPVVDVREPWETEIAPFHGAVNLPLGNLASVDVPFSHNTTLYTLCKADYRSLEGAKILRQRGWKNVVTIMGGMDALSDLDDDYMPY